jgi:hypothetical protein
MGLNSLGAFVLLRARAAAATGHPDECVQLCAVLWRLHQVVTGEGYLYSPMMDYWAVAAQDVCRSREKTDSMLAALRSQPGSYWFPEAEMLHTWNRAAAIRARDWMRKLSDSSRGFWFASFCREWADFDRFLGEWGPSGWHDQNFAFHLHRSHDFFAMPLKSGGFAALRSAMKAIESESPEEQNTVFRMFHLDIIKPGTVEKMAGMVTRARLTLVTLAMERFRLKNGAYPAQASELVPDFIDEIPPGVDGLPLGIVASSDKSTSLVYSATWQEPGAAHREPPPSSCGTPPPSTDEWSLVLPLPGL